MNLKKGLSLRVIEMLQGEYLRHSPILILVENVRRN